MNDLDSPEGRLQAVHVALVWAQNAHMDGPTTRRLLFEVVQTGNIPQDFQFDREAHSARVDKLAALIWSASHHDEGSISATGALIIAKAIIDHVPEPEIDQRIVAWDRIAKHPFFRNCYGTQGTLLDAMLTELDASNGQV